MEINWFTVVAQVLNFFILVWLLRRYLYTPILKAIDDRERNISARLNDADVKKATAKKEQDDFHQKNVDFDQQKKDRMKKVVSETAAEREKLLNQARLDAESLAKLLATAAKEQQHHQHLELTRKIKEEVFAISRNVLADLATVELEEPLIHAFIKRLKALKGKELNAFKAAFEESSDSITVCSAFALPQQLQKELNQVIDDVLSTSTSVRFESTPAVIGGIELRTHEYKLAWSVSEYLRGFEEIVSQTDTPVLKKQNV